MTLMQRMLNAEARAQGGWSPENEYAFVSQKRIFDIWADQRIPTWTRIALWVSFTLGQRVGDTLRWRVSKVRLQRFPYLLGEVISITVVEGKTVEKTGAYTLHIPSETHTGQLIHLLHKEAQQTQSRYLFFHSEVILQKVESQAVLVGLEKKMHADLTAANNDIDLRAVRRGGLTQMALNGYPLTSIMLFSQHRSVDILKRYLADDLFNGSNAQQMSEVIQYQESMPQQNE